MKLIYDAAEASFEEELNEATGKKSYVIKGIFSSPGEQNKNGRTYPMSIWESEVAKYQDVMKNGLSNSLLELDHPARTNVEMMEAVAKMRKLYMKDGKVMGEAVLLDNPRANQLKTLIDNGIKMSVSSRGVGSVVENVVKDYKLITFDIIPDQGQSDHNAEMMGITEGILETKEFEVQESGLITEVQMCTEDACHLFEAEDIQKATMEKFLGLMENLSKSDINEGKKEINAMKKTLKTFDTSLDEMLILLKANKFNTEAKALNKIGGEAWELINDIVEKN